jgi:hypothetical protein
VRQEDGVHTPHRVEAVSQRRGPSRAVHHHSPAALRQADQVGRGAEGLFAVIRQVVDFAVALRPGAYTRPLLSST